jgi:predicted transcriptional regulator
MWLLSISLYQLTEEERAAVEEGLVQAERGEFASDHEVAAVWVRYGILTV